MAVPNCHGDPIERENDVKTKSECVLETCIGSFSLDAGGFRERGLDTQLCFTRSGSYAPGFTDELNFGTLHVVVRNTRVHGMQDPKGKKI